MSADVTTNRAFLCGGFRATRHIGAVLAVAALSLSACADRRGGKIPYDVKNFGSPDAPVALQTNETYHVGPGDELSVVVFRVPDMSGDVAVDMTGNFTMPLIGQVQAIGKTTDQLQTELTQRLGTKYLQNPEVRVAVKTASNQRVTIDGSVKQAGIYPITPSTTLLQAIALAKGPDTDANPRRIIVFRMIGGQRQAASFDLTDIRRGLAPDPAIYGNDVIVVDGNQLRKNFKDTLSALPLLSIFRPF
ncbi:polysaccharide biosynthesis/export family protein [Sphingomonas sp. PB4P5]|uniref:polysaccharide biosynthesis/export family protein n=1 Tax=Parasphingomonas puruogangriensis TaxID=3096155 RepID=UPI002FC5B896